MSLSPGGRFRCGIHQFSTNDQLEWRKHNAEEVHTQTGNALCNYCGTPTRFSYTGKIERPMAPALCNDCKQKINQTIQNM